MIISCLHYAKVVTILLDSAGERGLEVRSHGTGPSVPLDLHAGSAGGNCRDHPTSSFPIRRQRAPGQAVLGCVSHSQVQHVATGAGSWGDQRHVCGADGVVCCCLVPCGGVFGRLDIDTYVTSSKRRSLLLLSLARWCALEVRYRDVRIVEQSATFSADSFHAMM